MCVTLLSYLRASRTSSGKRTLETASCGSGDCKSFSCIADIAPIHLPEAHMEATDIFRTTKMLFDLTQQRSTLLLCQASY